MKTKPRRFDIYEFLAARPLSYSAINTFSDEIWGNPEKWYQSYILGIRESSKQLEFGSMVDKRIQKDPTFIPTLPRYPEMQFKLLGNFSAIPMIGFPDGLCLNEFLLADYKTGVSPWTQKKADETDQLTMYLLLIYILYKVRPENFKLYIHWMPTLQLADLSIRFRDDPVVPVTFETKRTMADLLRFGQKIKDTVEAMEKYVRNHKNEKKPIF